MADEDKIVVSTPDKPEHGAQVRLTGEARAAARGALAGSLEDNTKAKRALEARGVVADGYSADGTTVTGERQPDDVQAEEQDTPTGEPAERLVQVEDEQARAEVQAADGDGGTTMTPSPEPEKQRAKPGPKPKV